MEMSDGSGGHMKSKAIIGILCGAGIVWFIVAANNAGDDARKSADDAASGLKAMQDKYGDGENGAGAENGNKWVYRTRDDAMRSQRLLFATETSTNAVLFSEGVGGASRLTLGIRSLRANEDDAYLVIDNGQFHCGIGNCKISAKFDDKQVETFEVVPPKDGAPDQLYVMRSAAFLEDLKRSKKAIIEAEFYRDGPKQFTFNTANLHWPPTKQDLAE
jgi:hypothetical protein